MKKLLGLLINLDCKARSRKTPLGIITTVAALFTLGCFFNLFLSVAIDASSLAVTIIALCMTLCAAVPLVFYTRLRRWAMVLSTVAVCFFTVTFVVFATVILVYPQNSPLPDSGDDVVVIVYGCRTYDRPSRMLQNRLDAAFDILERYPNATCIVTGGQGLNEPISEGLSMYSYLVERGIDEGRIIIEDKARNTVENVSNSLAIMRERGLSTESVVSVSDNYHLMRIKYLASRLGLDTYIHPAYFDISFKFLSSLTREYFSYVKMIVF